MRTSMPRVLRRVLHRSFSSQDDRLFAVVSGGSKGIGLSFTKALLSHSNQHVIALSRNHSEELQTLEQQYPGRLQWIQTDLENEDSIKSATSAVAATFPKVDILINCAGILGNGSPSQPGPERTVSAITKDWLVKSFEVNLFGHVILTKELLPLMKRKSDKNPQDIAKIVNISAHSGSISDNKLGGWYSYRMSKAAMNMFTKTLSLEIKRFGTVVVAVHPGTADTDLSTPFKKNVPAGKLFTADQSVEYLMNNVVNKIGLADTGKFYNYDGTEIGY